MVLRESARWNPNRTERKNPQLPPPQLSASQLQLLEEVGAKAMPLKHEARHQSVT